MGISLNNGFGRPWFANAPDGSDGDGTITVTDPNGAPLRGAPSLTAAALATGLTTKSPDGTGRAVFLAALADGSVVQVHVQKGVDGLVPPGSFTAIPGISRERAESNDPAVVTRAGMLFNWVPQRNVLVSDPLANRILVVDLTDDGTLLQAANARYITSPVLQTPVDLAPAVREAGARNFSSNTTLGGGSDFYVLNRGNNSIVRMTQVGDVVAVRYIESSVEGFRLNGAFLYSDLLLHDMGPGLADGFTQGSATSSEFRTAPLWGVSTRQHFLHDGRAATIVDAIFMHGGQATAAVDAFNALSPADRQAVLNFLNGI